MFVWGPLYGSWKAMSCAPLVELPNPEYSRRSLQCGRAGLETCGRASSIITGKKQFLSPTGSNEPNQYLSKQLLSNVMVQLEEFGSPVWCLPKASIEAERQPARTQNMSWVCMLWSIPVVVSWQVFHPHLVRWSGWKMVFLCVPLPNRSSFQPCSHEYSLECTSSNCNP